MWFHRILQMIIFHTVSILFMQHFVYVVWFNLIGEFNDNYANPNVAIKLMML